MPFERKRKEKVKTVVVKADPDSLQAQAESLLAEDPLLWGQQFLPNHFRSDTPKFHYEIINAAVEFDKFAVASPRGSAKSTLLLFLFPFHGIMFRKYRFIVIVSNTFKKAAMHLDAMKKELTENQELIALHPRITMPRDAEGDTIFRHPDGFETMVLCKGVEQIGSLRGVKFGAWRPDLVMGDDMEDDELVRSPERRAQLQEDFDSVLTPIGGDINTKHVYVGTILHDDCQLAKLVSRDHYQEYFKLFYAAHINADTPEESSLWPYRYTLEFLHDLRRNKPLVYAKEYQNNPVAGLNSRFQKEDFRYWREENGKVTLLNVDGSVMKVYDYKDCKAAIACDLAWKEKRTADSTVLMPGFLTPNAELLVESYICKKGMRPDELAEQLFVMVARLEGLTGSTVPIGFEKAMLENVSQWLLKREMQRRNKYLLTKELVWDSDKNTRIETRLIPRYSQSAIYHKPGMGDLEHQLVRHPYATHDDLADALQALVQLLQYPKSGRAEPKKRDLFAELQQLKKKAETVEKFKGFGKRTKRRGIPARRTLW